ITEKTPKCYAITHKRDTPCGGTEHNCPLEIVKSTGKATVVEHIHFDRNGNANVYEVHGHPIFDDNGNVIQMIEYSIEITDRKKLERSLIQRTVELNSLIERSPSPIAIYTGSGELIETNRQWKGFFSIAGTRIFDKNILENEYLINNGHLHQIRKIMSGGGKIKTEPILLKLESKIVVFNIYSTENEYGKVDRIVCLIEDRSDEVKRAEIKNELKVQKKLSAAVIDILESERMRVSKELHDQIGQKLLLAKLELEMIEEIPNDEKFNLKKVKDQLLEVSKDIKSVIYSLHPAELETYGLIDAVDLMLKKFADLSKIKVNFNCVGKYFRANKKIELNIYRIIQEAFNNISKHSFAKNIEVELQFTNDLISVNIKDDGVGFSVRSLENKKLNNGSGYGLISMKERTYISGGEFSIHSEPGNGTNIQIKIPLNVISHE
ncbi:MAG: ATP-binding protein, partial [Ignavibacteria bacterium]|nr:ATP-binding protein [Ignavibacteria bacterium]